MEESGEGMREGRKRKRKKRRRRRKKRKRKRKRRGRGGGVRGTEEMEEEDVSGSSQFVSEEATECDE